MVDLLLLEHLNEPCEYNPEPTLPLANMQCLHSLLIAKFGRPIIDLYGAILKIMTSPFVLTIYVCVKQNKTKQNKS